MGIVTMFSVLLCYVLVTVFRLDWFSLVKYVSCVMYVVCGIL